MFFKASEIGLAYVYGDYRDHREQTIEHILGAILKQLLRRLSEIPETVLDVHGKLIKQEKPLDTTNAVDLLRIACAQFSKVYVCLDALDEIGDLRGLLKPLSELRYAIQLFITGRPYI